MSHPVAFDFPPYRLLPAQRQLLSAGAPVKLGGRAFDVLLALVERRDRTVGKHELIELVWPRLVVEENNLQVQMVALRKLLGHAAIVTVPGRGYRFTLPVQVQGGASPADGADAAASEEAATPPGQLLRPRPELIGREPELRELLELLEAHTLVTIAGAGGIGKTRLAEAAAAVPRDTCPDGAWWVDLTAVSEPALIEESVAHGMGFCEREGADAVAALWAALPGRAGLLVLDNAEHVLPGVAAFTVRLLRDAPRMRVLVTSQEVLRVPGERVFRPDPLALPDGDDPAAIAASAAVALFVARARAVSRHFELDGGNRLAVADICRRLDGIPLAIELAAARVALLGVDGLRDRLDQRFHVLTGGQRNSMRRHQTLRAALVWSHELLSPQEQAVLRRLAVFVGGFSLDAAQQVAEDEAGIDRWDVLEHLGALVDKSLVMVEGLVTPRYRLLESTRLFALERLIDAGEVDSVRARHLDHFLAVAESAREQMLRAEPAGLRRLDRERDNLLQALAWRPAGADATRSLRLVAALRLYWTSRGLLSRELDTANAALEHARGQAASIAHCQVLSELGFVHRMRGDLQAALARAEEAVSMARELGDPSMLGRTLGSAGIVLLVRGEAARARACAAEAVALTAALGDCAERANAMSLQAAVHAQAGETAMAIHWHEQVLLLRQRLGQPFGVAMARLELASTALAAGAHEVAAPQLREVLTLLPRLDSEYVASALLHEAAAWAAAAGHAADGLALEAAGIAQMRRVGVEGGLSGEGRVHLDRVRASIDAAARAEAESRGRAMGLTDALGRVARLLGSA